MATFYEIPCGNDANFTISGVPATGAKLFTYLAGTTTKQTTYTDSTGGTPNANPIILSSNGYPASGGNVVGIWVAQGIKLKLVLAPSTDTDPPTSPYWTRDQIAAINDPTQNLVVNSEWVLAGTPTFISGTSFSVTGDQTANFNKGRRLKSTNSGGTIYSYVVSSVFATVTTVTVINDSGVLDSGLSAVSYGLLSGTNPSVPPFESTPVVVDSTDATKRVKIAANRITTATTRTLTSPDIDGTVAVNVNTICQGRLTLTSATPVTTADVTAATLIYFTPYKGNSIALYDGNIWNILTFAELSLNVPATTVTMYDVFAYNNAGVVAIEALAWTNDTTRATALALQDGVYVKSGTTTRRYLGSFRTTGVSGQTEDSITKRYLWNYYNRTVRKMLRQETTATWNYTLTTYQQANASALNQLDFIVGLQENPVKANVMGAYKNTGAVGAQVGVGVDSTSSNTADLYPAGQAAAINTYHLAHALYQGFPGVGRHILVWLEASSAAGTTTWAGTDVVAGLATSHSGIAGEMIG